MCAALPSAYCQKLRFICPSSGDWIQGQWKTIRCNSFTFQGIFLSSFVIGNFSTLVLSPEKNRSQKAMSSRTLTKQGSDGETSSIKQGGLLWFPLNPDMPTADASTQLPANSFHLLMLSFILWVTQYLSNYLFYHSLTHPSVHPFTQLPTHLTTHLSI